MFVASVGSFVFCLTSTSSYLQKRVSSERCAELTIIAASHGLKEAWISYQVGVHFFSFLNLRYFLIFIISFFALTSTFVIYLVCFVSFPKFQRHALTCFRS